MRTEGSNEFVLAASAGHTFHRKYCMTGDELLVKGDFLLLQVFYSDRWPRATRFLATGVYRDTRPGTTRLPSARLDGSTGFGAA